MPLDVSQNADKLSIEKNIAGSFYNLFAPFTCLEESRSSLKRTSLEAQITDFKPNFEIDERTVKRQKLNEYAFGVSKAGVSASLNNRSLSINEDDLNLISSTGAERGDESHSQIEGGRDSSYRPSREDLISDAGPDYFCLQVQNETKKKEEQAITTKRAKLSKRKVE